VGAQAGLVNTYGRQSNLIPGRHQVEIIATVPDSRAQGQQIDDNRGSLLDASTSRAEDVGRSVILLNFREVEMYGSLRP
jgi:hypothetical protein